MLIARACGIGTHPVLPQRRPFAPSVAAADGAARASRTTIEHKAGRRRLLSTNRAYSLQRGKQSKPIASLPRVPLDLTREQILAFRRRVSALDERLPRGARSLRRAAWAGLQDSMPRAALLSIHARVEGAHPSIWEDPPLVQVWGPRYSTYVVPAQDRALFTLGRLTDDAEGRARAEEIAAQLHAFLDGRVM